MVLRRWDPFRELRNVEHAINQAWRGYGGDAESPPAGSWRVPLDVVREEDGLTVHASLPGIDAENIEVSVEDSVLTIAAATLSEAERKQDDYLLRERRSGSFRRSLRLPDSVDTEAIKPVYRNGVLTITIPKAESGKPRRLAVASE